MTRQPERLADLFPGVLAELAARHIPQQRAADVSQPADADVEWTDVEWRFCEALDWQRACALDEGRAR